MAASLRVSTARIGNEANADPLPLYPLMLETDAPSPTLCPFPSSVAADTATLHAASPPPPKDFLPPFALAEMLCSAGDKVETEAMESGGASTGVAIAEDPTPMATDVIPPPTKALLLMPRLSDAPNPTEPTELLIPTPTFLDCWSKAVRKSPWEPTEVGDEVAPPTALMGSVCAESKGEAGLG